MVKKKSRSGRRKQDNGKRTLRDEPSFASWTRLGVIAVHVYEWVKEAIVHMTDQG